MVDELKLDELREQIESEGYAETTTPKFSGALVDPAQIDADAAAASACPAGCGRVGCDYYAFQHSSGAYRAVAACPRCGEAIEF